MAETKVILPAIHVPIADRGSMLANEAWYRFWETILQRTGGDFDNVFASAAAAQAAAASAAAAATAAEGKLSASLVSDFMLTVLNDPDAVTALATLGAAALVHSHLATDISDFSTAIGLALLEGAGVTITDNGDGTFTISAAGGGGSSIFNHALIGGI